MRNESLVLACLKHGTVIVTFTNITPNQNGTSSSFPQTNNRNSIPDSVIYSEIVIFEPYISKPGLRFLLLK
jgi:hypothetical protein